MYIREIEISSFLSFKDTSVPFHERVTVIIGLNSTGKRKLLRAIGLVLGNSDGHKLDRRKNVLCHHLGVKKVCLILPTQKQPSSTRRCGKPVSRAGNSNSRICEVGLESSGVTPCQSIGRIADIRLFFTFRAFFLVFL